jgi:septal ring factor EnvC (AmiA/AmiB activator)
VAKRKETIQLDIEIERRNADQAQRRLDQLEKEITQVNKAQKDGVRTSKQAASALEEHAKAAKDLSRNFKAVDSSIDDATQSLRQQTNALDQAEKQARIGPTLKSGGRLVAWGMSKRQCALLVARAALLVVRLLSAAARQLVRFSLLLRRCPNWQVLSRLSRRRQKPGRLR